MRPRRELQGSCSAMYSGVRPFDTVSQSTRSPAGEPGADPTEKLTPPEAEMVTASSGWRSIPVAVQGRLPATSIVLAVLATCCCTSDFAFSESDRDHAQYKATEAA